MRSPRIQALAVDPMPSPGVVAGQRDGVPPVQTLLVSSPFGSVATDATTQESRAVRDPRAETVHRKPSLQEHLRFNPYLIVIINN